MSNLFWHTNDQNEVEIHNTFEYGGLRNGLSTYTSLSWSGILVSRVRNKLFVVSSHKLNCKQSRHVELASVDAITHIFTVNCHLSLVIWTDFLSYKKEQHEWYLTSPHKTSTLLLSTLKWMSLMDRVLYYKTVMVYKSLNGLSPWYMQDMFKYVTDVNVRSTRNTDKSKLYLPGGKNLKK